MGKWENEMERKKAILNERKKVVQSLIKKYANKIIETSREAVQFGRVHPKRGITGWKNSGVIRHWGKMAKKSILATRKKIDKLQEELKSL